MTDPSMEFDLPGDGKLVVAVRHKGRHGLMRDMHRIQRERCNHGDVPCAVQGIGREVYASVPLPFLAGLLRNAKAAQRPPGAQKVNQLEENSCSIANY